MSEEEGEKGDIEEEEEESKSSLTDEESIDESITKDVSKGMEEVMKRTMESTQEMLGGMMEGMPSTTQRGKMTPEMKEMDSLIRSLMDVNTTLVIKVASCDCKQSAKCDVYNEAKKIARLIDKIQSMRPRLEKMLKKARK